MNNKYKILIIEDEDNIRNLVSVLLDKNGYRVIAADNFKNGQMMFASHRPDLVILDLGLPDCDGMDFVKEVREENLTPIIVLSARTDDKDKVSALDLGANDYVTKPFSSEELLARIRSTLRHYHSVSSGGRLPGEKFTARELEIDYDSRRVYMGKEEIKLTKTEYDIIALLSEHSGKVMTYSAIIKTIWGYNDLNSKKKLQVNMANIRKKFGDKPGKENYIVNELGVGYRMCDETQKMS